MVRAFKITTTTIATLKFYCYLKLIIKINLIRLNVLDNVLRSQIFKANFINCSEQWETKRKEQKVRN